MDISEMKRIKLLLFEASNAKNASLVEGYIADKIIWHEGCAGEYGSDVVFELPKKDFIDRNILNTGGFPRKKEIIHQIAEDDKVYTLFTVEGNHSTGNCMGYPPTGKHIRYNAQYTARFENGLIVEIWATMDGHYVLKQLGIIK